MDKPRELIAPLISELAHPGESFDALFDAAIEQGPPGDADPQTYLRTILLRAKEIERERMAANVRRTLPGGVRVALLGEERRIIKIYAQSLLSVEPEILATPAQVLNDPDFRREMTNRGFDKVVFEYSAPNLKKKCSIRLHPEKEVDVAWAKSYTAMWLYEMFLTLAEAPQVVLSGRRRSHWRIEIRGFSHVRSLLSDDVLASFMKCFNSVDRLRAIESFAQHENLDVPASPGDIRRIRTAYVLKLSALFEVTRSVDDLNKVLAKVGVDRALLKKLSNENRKITSGKFGEYIARMRNQAGYHMGDMDI